MTKAERDELRKLANEATSGPWWARNRLDGDIEIESEGAPLGVLFGDDTDERCWPAARNATFITTARNALPALLDALDAADARIAELEAKLKTVRAETLEEAAAYLEDQAQVSDNNKDDPDSFTGAEHWQCVARSEREHADAIRALADKAGV